MALVSVRHYLLAFFFSIVTFVVTRLTKDKIPGSKGTPHFLKNGCA